MDARIVLASLALVVPAAGQAKQIARGAVEAPYALTAADGTGLRLVALDARAVVDGPLAFTELRLTFENPQPRVIEGHFKVTMPDGAAISRFAMKIGGRWMEGEVVEKQAARRAYEDALHRRQDPALLEQDAGNTFRARVFPIPASGRKELIVSWSHELTRAGEAYRLPLRGLPEIESLSLTALTAAAAGSGPKTSLGGSSSRYAVSKVEKANYRPEDDWIVYGGEVPAGGEALRSGDLAVARFVVPGEDRRETLAEAVVAFDTSASRALDFDARLRALAELVHGLSSIGVRSVRVVAFDQTAEEVYAGAPGGFGEAALARLRARGALGASSLEVALAAIEATSGPDRRVLFVTDGQITAGETDREVLRRRLAGLAKVGVRRVDAIVDTTARDPAVLEMLVTSDLPSPGKVIEGRDPLERQLAVLGRRTMADVTVAVPGAEWVWPDRVRGLQGGDAVVVFADLPAGKPLTVQLGGGADLRVAPPAREAEQPLLERAWVAARIQRLLDLQTRGDPDLKAALRHQIIALSTRHRVLSPYTALVVLETEHDYARFGIDRRALSDILVVGPTGIERVQRHELVVARTPPPAVVREPAEKRAAPEMPAPGAVTAEADPAPAAEAHRTRFYSFDHLMVDGPRAEDLAAEIAAPPPAPSPVEADLSMAPPAEPERPSPAPRPPARRRSSGARPAPSPPRRRRALSRIAAPTGPDQGRRELREIESGKPALVGELAEIDGLLARGRTKEALKRARAWRERDVTDLLALVALGRGLARSGDEANAARAFGSIIDLYPSRADMRRMAGDWLAHLGRAGLELALDTYRKAAAQRPDHPSVYHLLAMTLVRLGRYEEALDALLEGLDADRVQSRFPGVERILAEDAQLVAAAWAAAEPGARGRIEEKLRARGLRIDGQETLRFVLTWETDANDVDFHVFDGHFDHAYYERPTLATGGQLYADVTTGYGPECFTIPAPAAFPYRLKAHYYRRGPMGYGAGMVQIIRHDGRGGLAFEDRPFVIMQDGAFVDLGEVDKGAVKVAR